MKLLPVSSLLLSSAFAQKPQSLLSINNPEQPNKIPYFTTENGERVIRYKDEPTPDKAKMERALVNEPLLYSEKLDFGGQITCLASGLIIKMPIKFDESALESITAFTYPKEHIPYVGALLDDLEEEKFQFSPRCVEAMSQFVTTDFISGAIFNEYSIKTIKDEKYLIFYGQLNNSFLAYVIEAPDGIKAERDAIDKVLNEDAQPTFFFEKIVKNIMDTLLKKDDYNTTELKELGMNFSDLVQESTKDTLKNVREEVKKVICLARHIVSWKAVKNLTSEDLGWYMLKQIASLNHAYNQNLISSENLIKLDLEMQKLPGLQRVKEICSSLKKIKDLFVEIGNDTYENSSWQKPVDEYQEKLNNYTKDILIHKKEINGIGCEQRENLYLIESLMSDIVIKEHLKETYFIEWKGYSESSDIEIKLKAIKSYLSFLQVDLGLDKPSFSLQASELIARNSNDHYLAQFIPLFKEFKESLENSTPKIWSESGFPFQRLLARYKSAHLRSDHLNVINSLSEEPILSEVEQKELDQLHKKYESFILVDSKHCQLYNQILEQAEDTLFPQYPMYLHDLIKIIKKQVTDYTNLSYLDMQAVSLLRSFNSLRKNKRIDSITEYHDCKIFDEFTQHFVNYYLYADKNKNKQKFQLHLETKHPKIRKYNPRRISDLLKLKHCYKEECKDYMLNDQERSIFSKIPEANGNFYPPLWPHRNQGKQEHESEYCKIEDYKPPQSPYSKLYDEVKKEIDEDENNKYIAPLLVESDLADLKNAVICNSSQFPYYYSEYAMIIKTAYAAKKEEYERSLQQQEKLILANFALVRKCVSLFYKDLDSAGFFSVAICENDVLRAIAAHKEALCLICRDFQDLSNCIALKGLLPCLYPEIHVLEDSEFIEHVERISHELDLDFINMNKLRYYCNLHKKNESLKKFSMYLSHLSTKQWDPYFAQLERNQRMLSCIGDMSYRYREHSNLSRKRYKEMLHIALKYLNKSPEQETIWDIVKPVITEEEFQFFLNAQNELDRITLILKGALKPLKAGEKGTLQMLELKMLKALKVVDSLPQISDLLADQKLNPQNLTEPQIILELKEIEKRLMLLRAFLNIFPEQERRELESLNQKRSRDDQQGVREISLQETMKLKLYNHNLEADKALHLAEFVLGKHITAQNKNLKISEIYQQLLMRIKIDNIGELAHLEERPEFSDLPGDTREEKYRYLENLQSKTTPGTVHTEFDVNAAKAESIYKLLLESEDALPKVEFEKKKQELTDSTELNLASLNLLTNMAYRKTPDLFSVLIFLIMNQCIGQEGLPGAKIPRNIKTRLDAAEEICSDESSTIINVMKDNFDLLSTLFQILPLLEKGLETVAAKPCHTEYVDREVKNLLYNLVNQIFSMDSQSRIFSDKTLLEIMKEITRLECTDLRSPNMLVEDIRKAIMNDNAKIKIETVASFMITVIFHFFCFDPRDDISVLQSEVQDLDVLEVEGIPTEQLKRNPSKYIDYILIERRSTTSLRKKQALETIYDILLGEERNFVLSTNTPENCQNMLFLFKKMKERFELRLDCLKLILHQITNINNLPEIANLINPFLGGIEMSIHAHPGKSDISEITRNFQNKAFRIIGAIFINPVIEHIDDKNSLSILWPQKDRNPLITQFVDEMRKYSNYGPIRKEGQEDDAFAAEQEAFKKEEQEAFKNYCLLRAFTSSRGHKIFKKLTKPLPTTTDPFKAPLERLSGKRWIPFESMDVVKHLEENMKQFWINSVKPTPCDQDLNNLKVSKKLKFDACEKALKEELSKIDRPKYCESKELLQRQIITDLNKESMSLAAKRHTISEDLISDTELLRIRILVLEKAKNHCSTLIEQKAYTTEVIVQLQTLLKCLNRINAGNFIIDLRQVKQQLTDSIFDIHKNLVEISLKYKAPPYARPQEEIDHILDIISPYSKHPLAILIKLVESICADDAHFTTFLDDSLITVCSDMKSKKHVLSSIESRIIEVERLKCALDTAARLSHRYSPKDIFGIEKIEQALAEFTFDQKSDFIAFRKQIRESLYPYLVEKEDRLKHEFKRFNWSSYDRDFYSAYQNFESGNYDIVDLYTMIGKIQDSSPDLLSQLKRNLIELAEMNKSQHLIEREKELESVYDFDLISRCFDGIKSKVDQSFTDKMKFLRDFNSKSCDEKFYYCGFLENLHDLILIIIEHSSDSTVISRLESLRTAASNALIAYVVENKKHYKLSEIEKKRQDHLDNILQSLSSSSWDNVKLYSKIQFHCEYKDKEVFLEIKANLLSKYKKLYPDFLALEHSINLIEAFNNPKFVEDGLKSIDDLSDALTHKKSPTQQVLPITSMKHLLVQEKRDRLNAAEAAAGGISFYKLPINLEAKNIQEAYYDLLQAGAVFKGSEKEKLELILEKLTEYQTDKRGMITIITEIKPILYSLNADFLDMPFATKTEADLDGISEDLHGMSDTDLLANIMKLIDITHKFILNIIFTKRMQNAKETARKICEDILDRLENQYSELLPPPVRQEIKDILIIFDKLDQTSFSCLERLEVESSYENQNHLWLIIKTSIDELMAIDIHQMPEMLKKDEVHKVQKILDLAHYASFTRAKLYFHKPIRKDIKDLNKKWSDLTLKKEIKELNKKIRLIPQNAKQKLRDSLEQELKLACKAIDYANTNISIPHMLDALRFLPGDTNFKVFMDELAQIQQMPEQNTIRSFDDLICEIEKVEDISFKDELKSSLGDKGIHSKYDDIISLVNYRFDTNPTLMENIKKAINTTNTPSWKYQEIDRIPKNIEDSPFLQEAVEAVKNSILDSGDSISISIQRREECEKLLKYYNRREPRAGLPEFHAQITLMKHLLKSRRTFANPFCLAIQSIKGADYEICETLEERESELTCNIIASEEMRKSLSNTPMSTMIQLEGEDVNPDVLTEISTSQISTSHLKERMSKNIGLDKAYKDKATAKIDKFITEITDTLNGILQANTALPHDYTKFILKLKSDPTNLVLLKKIIIDRVDVLEVAVNTQNQALVGRLFKLYIDNKDDLLEYAKVLAHYESESSRIPMCSDQIWSLRPYLPSLDEVPHDLELSEMKTIITLLETKPENSQRNILDMFKEELAKSQNAKNKRTPQELDELKKEVSSIIEENKNAAVAEFSSLNKGTMQAIKDDLDDQIAKAINIQCLKYSICEGIRAELKPGKDPDKYIISIDKAISHDSLSFEDIHNILIHLRKLNPQNKTFLFLIEAIKPLLSTHVSLKERLSKKALLEKYIYSIELESKLGSPTLTSEDDTLAKLIELSSGLRQLIQGDSKLIPLPVLDYLGRFANMKDEYHLNRICEYEEELAKLFHKAGKEYKSEGKPDPMQILFDKKFNTLQANGRLVESSRYKELCESFALITKDKQAKGKQPFKLNYGFNQDPKAFLMRFKNIALQIARISNANHKLFNGIKIRTITKGEAKTWQFYTLFPIICANDVTLTDELYLHVKFNNDDIVFSPSFIYKCLEILTLSFAIIDEQDLGEIKKHIITYLKEDIPLHIPVFELEQYVATHPWDLEGQKLLDMCKNWETDDKIDLSSKIDNFNVKNANPKKALSQEITDCRRSLHSESYAARGLSNAGNAVSGVFNVTNLPLFFSISAKKFPNETARDLNPQTRLFWEQNSRAIYNLRPEQLEALKRIVSQTQYGDQQRELVFEQLQIIKDLNARKYSLDTKYKKSLPGLLTNNDILLDWQNQLSEFDEDIGGMKFWLEKYNKLRDENSYSALKKKHAALIKAHEFYIRSTKKLRQDQYQNLIDIDLLKSVMDLELDAYYLTIIFEQFEKAREKSTSIEVLNAFIRTLQGERTENPWAEISPLTQEWFEIYLEECVKKGETECAQCIGKASRLFAKKEYNVLTSILAVCEKSSFFFIEYCDKMQNLDRIIRKISSLTDSANVRDRILAHESKYQLTQLSGLFDRFTDIDDLNSDLVDNIPKRIICYYKGNWTLQPQDIYQQLAYVILSTIQPEEIEKIAETEIYKILEVIKAANKLNKAGIYRDGKELPYRKEEDGVPLSETFDATNELSRVLGGADGIFNSNAVMGSIEEPSQMMKFVDKLQKVQALVSIDMSQVPRHDRLDYIQNHLVNVDSLCDEVRLQIDLLKESYKDTKAELEKKYAQFEQELVEQKEQVNFLEQKLVEQKEQVKVLEQKLAEKKEQVNVLEQKRGKLSNFSFFMKKEESAQEESAQEGIKRIKAEISTIERDKAKIEQNMTEVERDKAKTEQNMTEVERDKATAEQNMTEVQAKLDNINKAQTPYINTYRNVLINFQQSLKNLKLGANEDLPDVKLIPIPTTEVVLGSYNNNDLSIQNKRIFDRLKLIADDYIKYLDKIKSSKRKIVDFLKSANDKLFPRDAKGIITLEQIRITLAKNDHSAKDLQVISRLEEYSKYSMNLSWLGGLFPQILTNIMSHKEFPWCEMHNLHAFLIQRSGIHTQVPRLDPNSEVNPERFIYFHPSYNAHKTHKKRTFLDYVDPGKEAVVSKVLGRGTSTPNAHLSPLHHITLGATMHYKTIDSSDSERPKTNISRYDYVADQLHLMRYAIILCKSFYECEIGKDGMSDDENNDSKNLYNLYTYLCTSEYKVSGYKKEHIDLVSKMIEKMENWLHRANSKSKKDLAHNVLRNLKALQAAMNIINAEYPSRMMPMLMYKKTESAVNVEDDSGMGFALGLWKPYFKPHLKEGKISQGFQQGPIAIYRTVSVLTTDTDILTLDHPHELHIAYKGYRITFTYKNGLVIMDLSAFNAGRATVEYLKTVGDYLFYAQIEHGLRFMLDTNQYKDWTGIHLLIRNFIPILRKGTAKTYHQCVISDQIDLKSIFEFSFLDMQKNTMVTLNPGPNMVVDANSIVSDSNSTKLIIWYEGQQFEVKYITAPASVIVCTQCGEWLTPFEYEYAKSRCNSCGAKNKPGTNSQSKNILQVIVNAPFYIRPRRIEVKGGKFDFRVSIFEDPSEKDSHSFILAIDPMSTEVEIDMILKIFKAALNEWYPTFTIAGSHYSPRFDVSENVLEKEERRDQKIFTKATQLNKGLKYVMTFGWPEHANLRPKYMFYSQQVCEPLGKVAILARSPVFTPSGHISGADTMLVPSMTGVVEKGQMKKRSFLGKEVPTESFQPQQNAIFHECGNKFSYNDFGTVSHDGCTYSLPGGSQYTDRQALPYIVDDSAIEYDQGDCVYEIDIEGGLRIFGLRKGGHRFEINVAGSMEVHRDTNGYVIYCNFHPSRDYKQLWLRRLRIVENLIYGKDQNLDPGIALRAFDVIPEAKGKMTICTNQAGNPYSLSEYGIQVIKVAHIAKSKPAALLPKNDEKRKNKPADNNTLHGQSVVEYVSEKYISEHSIQKVPTQSWFMQFIKSLLILILVCVLIAVFIFFLSNITPIDHAVFLRI